MALDGSRERSITLNDDYGPEIACWSPDSRHIAVVAYVNSAFAGGEKLSKIYVVDADDARIKDVALPNVAELKLYGDIEWTAVSMFERD